MQKTRDATDITDARLAAVSAQTLARLERLAGMRADAGIAMNAAAWRAPVYAPAPANGTPAAKGPQA